MRAWTRACSAARWLRPCWCCGWSRGQALQRGRHSGTDGNSAIPCYSHQYFQSVGKKLDNQEVRTNLTCHIWGFIVMEEGFETLAQALFFAPN